MKRFLLPLTSVLLLHAPLHAQRGPAAELGTLMTTAHQRGIFNGNVLVVQKGVTVYQASFGYADVPTQKPLTATTRFDVGSISKEFNGASILLLHQRGKLSLDDPLTRFFPELPAWAREVHVRNLIDYTSGIPNLGSADMSDEALQAALLQVHALVAAPGSAYLYNYVNVYLQRRIVEKVSGMPYAAFVQKNLFLPSGMHDARMDYPLTAPDMAHAFDDAGTSPPHAAGNEGWVRLPIGDLYRWTVALHSGRILNAQSLKVLGHNFPGGESSLGTAEFAGDALIMHQHQGSNYNYEAAFYCDIPQGITIILMTNNQQMKVWPLKTAILNILAGKPYVTPKKSFYLAIRDRVLANVDDGLAYYRHLKATGQEQYDFSFEIADLLSTGKYLQRRKKYDDALKVYAEAVKLQAKPADVSYGYELMGQSYAAKGDRANAEASYRHAVQLDPGNKNAAGMLAELEAH